MSGAGRPGVFSRGHRPPVLSLVSQQRSGSLSVLRRPWTKQQDVIDSRRQYTVDILTTASRHAGVADCHGN